MQTMTSRKTYWKLNSFKGTMHNDTTKKMVEGQQALINYLQAKLAIFEEKHAEVTGKERPDLTDSNRIRLARAAHGLNAEQLEQNAHTIMLAIGSATKSLTTLPSVTSLGNTMTSR